MMSIVNAIIDAINQCPEYIGKGIVQLLVLTLGGIIVAWITTLVFGRKSEINAVEGALLKRKMDIYEELCGKLEALKAVVIIPSDIHEAAVKMLEEERIAFNPINSNQLLSIFDSPRKLTDTFLELDKYIASKKLYYDNEVMIQTMRFQNYFAVFRRLLVMFEGEFVNAGMSLEGKEVAAAERILTAVLGIMLQEELIEQMDKVITTMKQSFMNLNFDHRDQIEYNYEFFNSPDGPIMGELMNAKIMEQREVIMTLVTKAVAMGMAGSILSDKKE
jgi:hypothetical protein